MHVLKSVLQLQRPVVKSHVPWLAQKVRLRVAPWYTGVEMASVAAVAVNVHSVP